MNSMRVGSNKQNPSEEKFYPSDQHLPRQPFQKSIKFQTKRVHFNCQTPLKKQETSENGKYKPAGPFESNQSMSSSMNMFPSE